jgi:DNA repair protein RadC
MKEVIRDLPRDDQPRERLSAHGPEFLSNAELLAIVLGSGLPGKNAIQLARELLAGGISALKKREMKNLAATAGMGPAKAARIVAMFEIARRENSGEPEEPPPYVATILGQTLVSRCARYRQERLGAVLLDSRHRIFKHREIFVGTINNALVSTRDILRLALFENATALVIYHNHPSAAAGGHRSDRSPDHRSTPILFDEGERNDGRCVISRRPAQACALSRRVRRTPE